MKIIGFVILFITKLLIVKFELSKAEIRNLSEAPIAFYV
jgi:hypothetical protein